MKVKRAIQASPTTYKYLAYQASKNTTFGCNIQKLYAGASRTFDFKKKIETFKDTIYSRTSGSVLPVASKKKVIVRLSPSQRKG